MDNELNIQVLSKTALKNRYSQHSRCKYINVIQLHIFADNGDSL